MHVREYREVIKMLTSHDNRFQIDTRRGKGSHHILYHPDIGGQQQQLPLPHHGKKTIIKIGILKDIIRIFDLPKNIFDNDVKGARKNKKQGIDE